MTGVVFVGSPFNSEKRAERRAHSMSTVLTNHGAEWWSSFQRAAGIKSSPKASARPAGVKENFP